MLLLLLSVGLVPDACNRTESGLGGRTEVSPTGRTEVTERDRTEVGPCPWTDVSPGDRSGPRTSGIKRALSSLAPNTAVAVVRTESGIERGAYGEFLPGRRADPRDRFDIGSTSKSFLATVVLQLIGEGRLTLEDRMGDLLSPDDMRFIRPARALPRARNITVRQLLNHSSGLSEGGELLFPPGTAHIYSNANYGLLGNIVEKVTGSRGERLVLDRILRPLDLHDTLLSPHGEGRWLGWPLGRGEAGGAISTVDDVATFFAALMGGKLLRPDLLSQMTRTIEAGQGLCAGLGIFELKTACGTAWGHGGQTPMYSTMSLASRDGSRVVVVAQTSGLWTAAKSVAEQLYCSPSSG
jgi:D-alanyl-D-alanine carboxypeptidase